MKAVKRRSEAAAPATKTTARIASSKLIKISPTQDLVERADRFLAGINHYRLPDGPEATRVLDLCETFDGIRTKLREKAKELLLREADAIPRWHVSDTPTRRLSGDTVKVYEAVEGELTSEEFMAACSTSLTALHKALSERNPHLSPDEVEFTLNRALVDLISFEKASRLSRSKGKQIDLSL
jgi:hypothetical protein